MSLSHHERRPNYDPTRPLEEWGKQELDQSIRAILETGNFEGNISHLDAIGLRVAIQKRLTPSITGVLTRTQAETILNGFICSNQPVADQYWEITSRILDAFFPTSPQT